MAEIVKAGTYDAKVNRNINLTNIPDDKLKDAVAAVSGSVVNKEIEDSV